MAYFLTPSNTKSCAVINLSLVLDGATVLLDDGRRNAESQAGAGFLGGKERIKEPLLDLGDDAAAIVGNFEDDDVGFFGADPLPIRPGAQLNHPMLPDGVGCILDQIDEDLLDLGLIHGDAQGGAVLRGEAGYGF
jgi:hypothetical protein